MHISRCNSCDAALDADDNFCRNCGISVGTSLPVARRGSEAIIWQPRVPSVVKGVAVMAAGTVGQFLVRRMVNNLVSTVARGRSRSIAEAPRRLIDEAQVVSETITVRRVRIRREA